MKPTCPKCGSDDTVMMIYGKPTEKSFNLAYEGKAVLRGCMVHGEPRNSLCRNCEHEFDYDWNLR